MYYHEIKGDNIIKSSANHQDQVTNIWIKIMLEISQKNTK